MDPIDTSEQIELYSIQGVSTNVVLQNRTPIAVKFVLYDVSYFVTENNHVFMHPTNYLLKRNEAMIVVQVFI